MSNNCKLFEVQYIAQNCRYSAKTLSLAKRVSIDFYITVAEPTKTWRLKQWHPYKRESRTTLQFTFSFFEAKTFKKFNHPGEIMLVGSETSGSYTNSKTKFFFATKKTKKLCETRIRSLGLRTGAQADDKRNSVS